MVVEVFKTNVLKASEARMLVDHIHASFGTYRANFDLEDCDHILRVVSEGFIQAPALIKLLNDRGFEGEVLPDDIPQLLKL